MTAFVAAEQEEVRNRPRRKPVRERPASPARIARTALSHVVELTGHDASSVFALEHTDDSWVVGVEVVETHRIPDTADILAAYEVRVDDAGELISYRRTRRYARGNMDRGDR